MIRQIVFTQEELVQMLQGKEVTSENRCDGFICSMEEPKSIYENTVKTCKPTVDSELINDFDLMRDGLLSVKEFMEKHQEFFNGNDDLLILASKREVKKETLKWNHNKTDEPLICKLTKKETNDLWNGKKTVNQIREAHGLPAITDIQSAYSINKRMRWTYVYNAEKDLPEDARRFMQYIKSIGVDFDFFKQYDSVYEHFDVYCDSDEQMKSLQDCWDRIQKEYYDELNK